ncbi:MAG TPA: TIM barrel protein [Pantanalinema sp.]
MPLFLSARSLAPAMGLAETLEVFRLAAHRRIALPGIPALLCDPAVMRPLQEAGCDLTVHHAFSDAPRANLAALDEDFRLRSIRLVEEVMTRAAELGVTRLSLMPGFALEETLDQTRASRSVPRELALDALMRSLDRLANVADARGMSLALTNSDMRHPAMLLGDADEISGMIQALQVPFLGVQADLGHALASARASGSGYEGAEALLAAIAPHLTALRLHETDRSGQDHRLPTESGWIEELLGQHPEWRALPMTLEARGVSLDRLLDTADRLESLAPKPLLGPAR